MNASLAVCELGVAYGRHIALDLKFGATKPFVVGISWLINQIVLTQLLQGAPSP